MIEVLTIALLLIGALFTLLGAIGLLYLKDVYLRMQAATKTSTLGVASMAVAVAVYFGDLETVITAFLVISFFFLTSPVAAHVIFRSAYLKGIEMEGRDELKEDELMDRRQLMRLEPEEGDEG